ncbi:exopolysaccharide production repressor protein [Mesorhizobium carmichaelinearum]|uniref:exopolysaccharide production repressor protein n=1 Tax=Mesorhizobium carmichaelinearum TaxID=1208188 RepID=UPI001FCE7A40|nr:exopolysaccharide production repressor protein [Mesorhizobium carmichaelinearum]
MALPFRTFFRVLVLVLCSNAATVYFGSHSIRLAILTTLACSLLLQVVYFASVLFLVWQSSRASRAGEKGLSISTGKGSSKPAVRP